MSPQPDPDVVGDLVAAADDVALPASSVRADYSWNLDGDVLRDLLMRTTG